MIACYDLTRCPPTYDVVAFLALAEIERLRRAEEHIDLRILPGPVGGFRRDGLWPRGQEAREALRDRVLKPLCWLLPSVVNVSVEVVRVDGWGAGQYNISLPAIVRALREGCRPLRALGTFAAPGNRPYVTFTLRECEHWPLRNSKTAEWMCAATELTATGTDVYIIRDTRFAGVLLERKERSGRVTQAIEASRSIAERAQLYAGATLNVGICNGPMWMAIFMDAPVLMLRPTTNEAGGCYDDRFYASHGVPRGGQLPTSPAYQKLVWEDDQCANIVRAVRDMLEATA